MTSRHPFNLEDNSNQKKDTRTRLKKYRNWLDQSGQKWYLPDLEAYRDYLLADDKDLSRATADMYISTVKVAYRKVYRGNNLRQLLEAEIGASDLDEQLNLSQEKIKHAIKRKTARVEHERPETIEHLNHEQIQSLIGQVTLSNKKDLRDLLTMSLILFTGMSEVEVSEVQMQDFEISGEKAIVHVPEVSGGTERFVTVHDDLFYSPRWWVNAFLEWKKQTGIQTGPAFRGFYRDGDSIRKHKMSTVAVNDILKRYLVDDVDSTQKRHFTAQALRRTYARRLFCNNTEFKQIGLNLGYTDTRTLRAYIGLPDAGSNKEARQRADGTLIKQQLSRFIQSNP
ncbi:MAG: site-specific integrase [Phototrophicaceae bacterium]